MNKKISNKDRKDWENFLSQKDTLHNKDISNNEKKKHSTKLCDLHGYSLEEANKKIESFIKDSYEKGLSKLIVVTGKGLHSNNDRDPYISKKFGILKHSIPEFIKNNHELNSLIREMKDAEIKDGGTGSFYIFLKKKL
mgnify:FL=1